MTAATHPRPLRVGKHSVEYFDPNDYLLGLVQRAVANSQNVLINDASGLHKILVMPERGEYCTNRELAPECFKQPATDFATVTVTDEEATELLGQAHTGRNLDELLWIATHHAAAGRLLNYCDLDDVIHLKHWPNFTRLPLTDNAVRIAALTSRYPTSAILGARMLAVPLDEMMTFYSAARASGAAVAINKKAEDRELKPHPRRHLLSRILHRISEF